MKTIALALTVFVIAAGVASGASGGDRMLYGCAFVTNLGSSSNVNVLVWDKTAPGAHGWVMFDGSGVNKTTNFVLDTHGWSTVPFHVTTFGTEHIKVGLLKPKLSYSFDFTLNAASDVTTKGCKAH